jgi:hypothetical protein
MSDPYNNYYNYQQGYYTDPSMQQQQQQQQYWNSYPQYSDYSAYYNQQEVQTQPGTQKKTKQGKDNKTQAAPSPRFVTHGNASTMNLESVLLSNIQSCPYFKDL